MCVSCVVLAKHARQPANSLDADETSSLVSASRDGRLKLTGTITATASDAFASTLTAGEWVLDGHITGAFSAEPDDRLWQVEVHIPATPIDLIDILAAWGLCPQAHDTRPSCPADIDGDGVVGPMDIMSYLKQVDRR